MNRVRLKTRERVEELKMSRVRQTKLLTAVSELTRNILDHGNSGTVTIEKIVEQEQSGIRAVFDDEGPGIENPDAVLKDHVSGEESDGLGLGLPGAKRLSDEFHLETSPGEGTRITILFWARSDQRKE